jgi:hypothetical protein
MEHAAKPRGFERNPRVLGETHNLLQGTMVEDSTLKMETLCSCETLVTTYRTIFVTTQNTVIIISIGTHLFIKLVNE